MPGLILQVATVKNVSCMKQVRIGKRMFLWSLPLLLSGFSASLIRAQSLPSADELVQKAVARAQDCEERTSRTGYTYTKVTIIEELDSAGKVKERKEKVYEVSLRDGCSYVKLVEVNGRPAHGADWGW